MNHSRHSTSDQDLESSISFEALFNREEEWLIERWYRWWSDIPCLEEVRRGSILESECVDISNPLVLFIEINDQRWTSEGVWVEVSLADVLSREGGGEENPEEDSEEDPEENLEEEREIFIQHLHPNRVGQLSIDLTSSLRLVDFIPPLIGEDREVILKVSVYDSSGQHSAQKFPLRLRSLQAPPVIRWTPLDEMPIPDHFANANPQVFTEESLGEVHIYNPHLDSMWVHLRHPHHLSMSVDLQERNYGLYLSDELGQTNCIWDQEIGWSEALFHRGVTINSSIEGGECVRRVQLPFTERSWSIYYPPITEDLWYLLPSGDEITLSLPPPLWSFPPIIEAMIYFSQEDDEVIRSIFPFSTYLHAESGVYWRSTRPCDQCVAGVQFGVPLGIISSLSLDEPVHILEENETSEDVIDDAILNRWRVSIAH